MWVGAPGAAASRSRFGGGSEPMVWGDFVLYQSPRRLYAKSVDVREDFLDVRGSRRRLEVAMMWHRDIALHLPIGVADDRLLSLLYGSMKNVASGVPPFVADVRFRARWASLWGSAPDFRSCCSCGEALSFADGARVSLHRDGPMCERCARDASASVCSVASPVMSNIVRAACSPRAGFAADAAEIDASVPDDDRPAIAAWLSDMISLHI